MTETANLSRGALVALVVGSMVGAGIFTLPAAFGRTTGVFGALLAWAIAGVGMLMLALVFQALSRRRPDLDAGIYAYAKAGFGNYLGFVSAFGYWVACCFACLACLVLIKATLGQFFPVFGDGSTPLAIVSASLMLWGVQMLVLRGVRQAAALNTIATVAKIVPIGLFIVFVIIGFDAEVFAENLWGGAAPGLATLRSQASDTMLVTVFVFVGIEGASVYSRYAKKRHDVGAATVLGRENAKGVPHVALWLSNGVIQLFLIVTWFAEYAFLLALKMTSAMTLLPYLLVGAYGLKLAWTGQTYAGEARARRIDWLRGLLATLYAAAMLLAGGAKFLLLSAMLYAPGTWLFAKARREHGAQDLFNRAERAGFVLLCLAAVAAVAGMASGAIGL